MPYTTAIKKGFLLVRHEGEVTASEARAARMEAIGLVRENRISRIVVDLREVTGEADSDELRLVMEGNAEVKPPRPHAAVIVREDQYPKLRFIEDFAVSRGMPIRVFVAENEAMSWLEG
jgi:hypothetical protein